MLYGGFDHTIDKKGRVSIPSKFRDDLGESFIICKAIANKASLRIYSFSEWEKVLEKFSQRSSAEAADLRRFVFDGAFNVEFDAQGRIVIPPSLREYAKLENSAHIIGMNNYVELWNNDIWDEVNKYNLDNIIVQASQFGL